ncbi:copper resistance CopC family protein [Geodermatophilus sp. FMUSA9-8]|uniref:copper resistance CopC family protein n=1 Tax=Geodermatophilus sp. FMUSA9-8 TaxID=3120155 RepID=UPI003009D6B2
MPPLAARPAPSLPRLAAALLLGLGLLLVAPGTASAHTGLRTTDPAADSTVTSTPQAVTLTFSASILGGDVTVTGPDGSPVGTGPVAHDGAVLIAPVALTAAGRHTVTWSAVSDDGHALDGTFAFEHAPPVAVTPSPTPAPAFPSTTPAPESAEPSAATRTAERTEAADRAADAADGAAEDGGTPGWLLPGVGAVAVAGAVAGGVVIGRRRR